MATSKEKTLREKIDSVLAELGCDVTEGMNIKDKVAAAEEYGAVQGTIKERVDELFTQVVGDDPMETDVEPAPEVTQPPRKRDRRPHPPKRTPNKAPTKLQAIWGDEGFDDDPVVAPLSSTLARTSIGGLGSVGSAMRYFQNNVNLLGDDDLFDLEERSNMNGSDTEDEDSEKESLEDAVDIESEEEEGRASSGSESSDDEVVDLTIDRVDHLVDEDDEDDEDRGLRPIEEIVNEEDDEDDVWVDDGKGGRRKQRALKKDLTERAGRTDRGQFHLVCSVAAGNFRLLRRKDQPKPPPGAPRLKHRGRFGDLPEAISKQIDALAKYNSWHDGSVSLQTRGGSRLVLDMKCSFCKVTTNPCHKQLRLEHEQRTADTEYPTPLMLNLYQKGDHNSHHNQADYETKRPGLGEKLSASDKYGSIPKDLAKFAELEYATERRPRSAKIHKHAIEANIIKEGDFPLDSKCGGVYQTTNRVRLMQFLRRCRKRILADAMANSVGALNTFMETLASAGDDMKDLAAFPPENLHTIYVLHCKIEIQNADGSLNANPDFTIIVATPNQLLNLIRQANLELLNIFISDASHRLNKEDFPAYFTGTVDVGHHTHLVSAAISAHETITSYSKIFEVTWEAAEGRGPPAPGVSERC